MKIHLYVYVWKYVCPCVWVRDQLGGVFPFAMWVLETELRLSSGLEEKCLCGAISNLLSVKKPPFFIVVMASTQLYCPFNNMIEDVKK